MQASLLKNLTRSHVNYMHFTHTNKNNHRTHTTQTHSIS